jgi:alpha-beta hydrolase superfamily lysophospholipase
VSVTERELQVHVDDLTLAGGISVADGARTGVLLLHGIPSNAPPDPSDRGYPGLAHEIAGKGISAAWLNMRAAKGQPGFFSIQGWVHDAAAAVTHLKQDEFRDHPLIIVGSSAGGAVAAQVARLGFPVDGVALLAAPADWITFAAHPDAGVERITQDAGMAVAPDVRADPSSWGAEFIEVSTERAITGVDVPILILHGDMDEVVPAAHAAKISLGAPQAEVHIIQGGGHQLRKDPRAVQLLVEWLERTWP